MRAAKGSVKSLDSKSELYKEHNRYLDALKGLAILLVVLGHSVQSYSTGSFDSNIIFRLIYSFHMPLFMFLSGAVAAYSLKPMGWRFIKNKFFILVIPFIAWFSLSYYLNGWYHHLTFMTFVHNCIISPDWGYWFLWVLFLNFCLLAIIKQMHSWISFIIVWLLIYYEPITKYGMGLVKWYLTFFLLGYIIIFYRKKLMKFRLPVLVICLVSFPILFSHWHRLYPPTFNSFHLWLIAHHIHYVYRALATLYPYLVPITGIGTVCLLVSIASNKYLYTALGFLGLYTMDIYVTHEYFLRYAFGQSEWSKIISAFVAAIILSLLVTILILRRFRWTNKILLGGRPNVNLKFINWKNWLYVKN